MRVPAQVFRIKDPNFTGIAPKQGIAPALTPQH
jgi:hypothetical protein